MAKVKGQVRGNNGLLNDGEAGRVLLRGQVLQDPVQVFMNIPIFGLSIFVYEFSRISILLHTSI